MKTGYLTDQRYLEHLTGPRHPEQPERLRVVMDAVRASGLLERLTVLSARPARLAEVLAVHRRKYLERLAAACAAGARYVDVPDSAVCPVSYELAFLSAGGVLAACDAVMSGQVNNAFCAVRPPGHHAEADRAMGFCLLNNVAIAARYLQRRHGLARVLILDWDAHHGNGTQHIFERDKSVFFCSIHEHPSYLYPGTGYAWECGAGAGGGATCNLPMRPHATDADYRRAFTKRFLPAAVEFAPQFVLISAGFDAHRDDPLATLELTDAGFAWMARQAKRLAERCCAGRLVSVLEGGYNLKVLRDCVPAHLRILLE